MLFSALVAAADLATLRNSERGDELSAEMLLLLTLVIQDGYLLFPSASERPDAAEALAAAFCLGRRLPPWDSIS